MRAQVFYQSKNRRIRVWMAGCFPQSREFQNKRGYPDVVSGFCFLFCFLAAIKLMEYMQISCFER